MKTTRREFMEGAAAFLAGLKVGLPEGTGKRYLDPEDEKIPPKPWNAALVRGPNIEQIGCLEPVPGMSELSHTTCEFELMSEDPAEIIPGDRLALRFSKDPDYWLVGYVDSCSVYIASDTGIRTGYCVTSGEDVFIPVARLKQHVLDLRKKYGDHLRVLDLVPRGGFIRWL